ncbi:MAG: PEP-CTERM sorting domain-containing protein [Verrucomicrobiae bacterium]|nr:PEP-CTERM sorting domain-containing protein [Verrucomicrobiae bacterium]
MKFNLLKASLFTLAAGFSIPTAGAVVLLGANFDGRTLATTNSTNDTASGLAWTLNGIADPGDLTAVGDVALANGFANFEAAGLFQGGDAGNVDRFAPDINIHNEGSWYVDIPFRVLGVGVSIDTVTLDAFTLNNGGAFQGVGRDLDISVSLTDASANSLGTLTVNDVFLHDTPAPPQPTQVSFEVGGLAVPAGEYTMRLSFGADNDLVGNNAGFDNLAVNGTVVPEPSGALLVSFGAGVLLIRRRR